MNEQKAGKKKTKPWLRARHKVIYFFFGPIVRLIFRLKYGVRADRFTEQGKEAWLVLYNHQTPADQFFMLMSFRGPVYHVATEDIFSNGFISSLLRWSLAPIPIQKHTTDLNAIKLMLQVAKEGGTIAIAPEGNRTYSGKTEHMLPTIASLAKKLKLPIALYRIEGGYGVQPRWSDRIRKGQLHSYVSRIIRPEEYAQMSKDELFRQIREGLYVNEAKADGRYLSGYKAEYLERAVYVCPFCGLSKFLSKGDVCECLSCGRKIRYGEDKRLTGEGFDFPFPFVNDWYEYQEQFVNRLDLAAQQEKPLFTDAADISEVLVYKKKVPFRKGANLSLYGDRVAVNEGGAGEMIIPFEEVQGAAVLGRNKLNFYYNKRIFQFKGDRHFNALKYMNFYYRYKNQTQGDGDGEFLGL